MFPHNNKSSHCNINQNQPMFDLLIRNISDTFCFNLHYFMN